MNLTFNAAAWALGVTKRELGRHAECVAHAERYRQLAARRIEPVTGAQTATTAQPGARSLAG
jgi:hypothetical protein